MDLKADTSLLWKSIQKVSICSQGLERRLVQKKYAHRYMGGGRSEEGESLVSPVMTLLIRTRPLAS